ncbi:hypothetical protein CEP51_013499 [Fusarium floridanum]|uniref:DUF5672 domain-containing protein n=1 Tax=Fusarium floridanum TaxID=1325733 RepID=A0A428QAD9_9HYPO|nr:hypothetical protein CEP51_013499 [Fusarium floridanum]
MPPNFPCRVKLVATLIASMLVIILIHPLDIATSRIPLSSPIPQFNNASKLALLVETRPLPILAPLILHFISVVPPDWPFLFMGSHDSIEAINASFAIRQRVMEGKLTLTPVPTNMSVQSQEMVSRFFTNSWLYEEVLHPAEWLLVFQTDSIICANSKHGLDDYLEYDWVGAPWSPNSVWGGNGGLSLRRVSRIVDVLRNHTRPHNAEPEDVWLTERLSRHPEAKLANGTVSLTFSGELHSGVPEEVDKMRSNGTRGDSKNARGIDDWREGFYEPMGYHTGGGGVWLHAPIWGTPELRKHIWSYCPEVKMTLDMDVERYMPGNCRSRWKM